MSPLLVILLAQAGGLAALGFQTSFLPLYLERELGVSDPQELNVWTGLTSAVWWA